MKSHFKLIYLLISILDANYVMGFLSDFLLVIWSQMTLNMRWKIKVNLHGSFMYKRNKHVIQNGHA